MKLIKKGLGKGLKALIPTVPLSEDENKDIQWIDAAYIQPNENQPRKNIDKEKLTELADSIKEHGVIQPIIVRIIDGNNSTENRSEDSYEIVAGERRWRACQLAGLTKIPVIIKNYSPQQVSEIALIENIQRENLNPIEEARAFKTLIDEHDLTQEELSKKIGKSRPYIANSLRLLNLSVELMSLLSEGRLTTGHARALLALEQEEIQKDIAYRIINERLSVRQVEELVSQIQNASRQIPKNISPTTDEEQISKDSKEKKVKLEPIINEIEDRLQTHFGTKVQLKHQKGKGKIEINYYSDEELDRLIEIILDEELR